MSALFSSCFWSDCLTVSVSTKDLCVPAAPLYLTINAVVYVMMMIKAKERKVNPISED